MTALEDKLHHERELLRKQALEIRTALRLPARAPHSDVMAAISELAADTPIRRARVEGRVHHLALIPAADPPLERAREVLLDAVRVVPGVEWVEAEPFASDPRCFLLSVQGGDNEDVARAVLRAFPGRTMHTAGTERVDVDGEAVWLCRARRSPRSATTIIGAAP